MANDMAFFYSTMFFDILIQRFSDVRLYIRIAFQFKRPNSLIVASDMPRSASALVAVNLNL